jgi:CDP-diacylglycerol--glycerol-3-phosphate 3-phosphatidyltransferase
VIGEWIRKRTAGVFQDVARIIARMGISANAITVLGLIVSAVAAYLIATGDHLMAGISLAIAGLLDGLDGSVARISGQQTLMGAFWDSIIDRFCETVVFLGVLVYFMETGSWTGVILSFVAAVSSLLVSYVRARAEGLGLAMRGGLLTRLERVAVLTIGLLLGHLIAVMWIIAILSSFTVFQRVYLVWAGLRQQEG